MRLVFVIVGIFALCVSGCEKPKEVVVIKEVEVTKRSQPATPEPVPKLSLPMQKTITGKDGRKLAVTIVSRSKTHISIVRDSDQKTFDLPIEKLSDLDQDFAKNLPVSIKIVKTAATIRLENRQKAVRKLEEDASQLEKELASGALNTSQASLVKGKIERLKREIHKLGGETSPSDFSKPEKKDPSEDF